MPRRGYYQLPTDPTRQRMWDGEEWVGDTMLAWDTTPRFPGEDAGPDAGPRRGTAAIICPHCGVQGRVTREAARVKRGISGGKATGAVLTGGISLLGTGLSRKVDVSRMHCGSCGSSWTVE